MGTPALTLTYHRQESSCSIDNKTYNFTIWFSTIAKSTDDVFVLTDMELYIPDGHIKFNENEAPINKNISVVLMFIEPVWQNDVYITQSEPIRTSFDGNITYEFIPPEKINLMYPLSGKMD